MTLIWGPKGYKRGDVLRYGLNEMTGKLASTETVYRPSANVVNHDRRKYVGTQNALRIFAQSIFGRCRVGL